MAEEELTEVAGVATELDAEAVADAVLLEKGAILMAARVLVASTGSTVTVPVTIEHTLAAADEAGVWTAASAPTALAEAETETVVSEMMDPATDALTGTVAVAVTG